MYQKDSPFLSRPLGPGLGFSPPTTPAGPSPSLSVPLRLPPLIHRFSWVSIEDVDGFARVRPKKDDLCVIERPTSFFSPKDASKDSGVSPSSMRNRKRSRMLVLGGTPKGTFELGKWGDRNVGRALSRDLSLPLSIQKEPPFVCVRGTWRKGCSMNSPMCSCLTPPHVWRAVRFG